MGKRKLLNVRSVLEAAVYFDEEVLKVCDTSTVPPIILDHIREQAFYARAILRKHEHTRKDVRVPAKA